MAPIEVSVPVECADRAAFLPAADALVLSDLHLGRGADSNVEAPLDDAASTAERLETLLERFDPATVVVAGDLLHSFSWVSRPVRERLGAITALVDVAGAEFVVTVGNHDAALADAFDGETTGEYRLSDGETVVLHGHDLPESDAERYVIGHDHPALSIDGRKRPCYLYGPSGYQDADLLVLPAFTTLARGTSVNRLRGGDFASPLVTDPGRMHPAIRDESADETLWFPPLSDCRRLL